MLEHYFVRPTTVDRMRAAWLGASIERFVDWLHEHRYQRAYVVSRVQILVHLARYAEDRGVTTIAGLPDLIPGFASQWVSTHHRSFHKGIRVALKARTTRPICQFLSVVDPGYRVRAPRAIPFEREVPDFIDRLAKDRGLTSRSIDAYYRELGRFEEFLRRLEVGNLADLTPTLLTAYVTERSQRHSPRTIRECCTVLKAFTTDLHRRGILRRPVADAVEAPRAYRLARIPRAISWPDVERLLQGIDRRTPLGRRDYAILLLLVTYGLRAREVAFLTLDAFDWKRGRVLVRDRKAGHSTAYPLSPAVAGALVDYLEHARPKTTERRVFIQTHAPYSAINDIVVSQRVTFHLRKTGIQVHRGGSHTLRHTCVQRLVDTAFSLKSVGDYLGHGSTTSTAVYAKVDIERLRPLALAERVL